MSAKARLLFAIASLFSTSLVIGSVLSLAGHYGDQARIAAVKPHVVASR
jgi:hypothetical protein